MKTRARRAWAAWAVVIPLATAAGPARAAEGDIHADIAGAVAYLARVQAGATFGDAIIEGEFPSYIEHARNIVVLGPSGKIAADSNLFSTALTHNLLARMVLDDPTLAPALAPTLGAAARNFEQYRDGEVYNFWRLQHFPANWLKPGQAPESTPLVRRPNHYPLNSRYMNAVTNIPNDADDTAMVYQALKLQEELAALGVISSADVPPAPTEIGRVFSRYRDVRRRNVNIYNLATFTLRTRAFMTWLAPESIPGGKFVAKLLRLPQANVPRPPLGANDVDCVVNANILGTLARYGELDTPGVADACRFINWAARSGRAATCGVYYPHRYSFHLAVSGAYAAGATCLEPAARWVVKDIVKRGEAARAADEAPWSDAHLDAPAFGAAAALNALQDLEALTPAGTAEAPRVAAARAQAVDQLRARRLVLRDGSVLWPPAPFFSGGLLLRRRMIWKSSAYATALAARGLQRELQRDSARPPEAVNLE